jgi:hypothetical protein
MSNEFEEDAWIDLERRLNFRLKPEVKSVEDAFADWGHSHRPEVYGVELHAFRAGWVAAIRNEWVKEKND